ncbi:hypothetical protein FMUND_12200 [Fusarium mundagurra]|uniref:Uncharacterized protein n=1 Tax=Fusarium mundagurra TaxID=1567541 RepID=A0A8H6D7C1_9HYPO|nr:hypothetical protein FMUND_12200 [Fusarium mundagurra]
MAKNDDSILIPLKLDAFVFNRGVCDGKPPPKDPTKPHLHPTAAKIAPISQPNYTFLRLDHDYIQPDILNPVELRNTWPAEFNSRFTDLGDDENRPYEARQGVYLHWTLPRLYRSSIVAADKKTAASRAHAEALEARGLPPHGADLTEEDGDRKPDDGSRPSDPAAPTFPTVPTRWLVIRFIENKDTIQPAAARERVKSFTAWVVESNRLRKLDDLGADVDLQVDVSPFISAADGKDTSVAAQAEVFIGIKTLVGDWEEKEKEEDQEDPNAPKFLKNFGLFSSSNQLFADYQPHNSNVFSMVDNFQYGETTVENGREQGLYLTACTASYYVIGWSAVKGDDLFAGPQLGPSLTRQDRLDRLLLIVKLAETNGQAKDVFKSWLESEEPTRSVCHAAMYDVVWSSEEKPSKVPADAYCTQLNSALPLAVGTTPLNALTTYARAHVQLGDPKQEDPTQRQLELWLKKLETLLLARDDGVESQQQAADLLYNWNFVRADGGEVWHASGDSEGSGSAQRASDKLIQHLRKMNRSQQLLDGVKRTLSSLERELFFKWWRVVSDPAQDNDHSHFEGVQTLADRITMLQERRDKIEGYLSIQKDKKGKDSVKPGAQPAFYQQRDPTLVVGGVQSGWEPDYLDSLLVRLESQTLGTTPKSSPPVMTGEPVWDGLESFAAKVGDTQVRSAIKRLVAEFVALRPGASPPESSQPLEMPLFHDRLTMGDKAPGQKEPCPKTGGEGKREAFGNDGPWRDRWNDSQPWFPLFLEWAITYFHVPFRHWSLEQRGSLSHQLPQLRYGIPATTNLASEAGGSNADKHTIRGRVLLLPQPSFSLAAKIDQLFSSTPADSLRPDSHFPLTPSERCQLQKELHKLSFLSAPLAGLSAHLTTLLQGTHIKPILRDPIRRVLEPVADAMRPDAGFSSAVLGKIGLGTDHTPFGTGVPERHVGQPSLFKPVTHGQFRFTKLNIIDKFGQAIHAIDPTPSLSPQRVWPIIGEWYAPQVKGNPKDKIPNVVEEESHETGSETGNEKDEEPPATCEFVQIPPQINQEARLNAAFVVPFDPTEDQDDDTTSRRSKMSSRGGKEPVPFWRPADEWENPIWGWVLINYANQGIQLFLQDGTFYREVRLAGRNGTQSLPTWLPFEPPSEDPDLSKKPTREHVQLQLLVARFQDEAFLRDFWAMVVRATNNMEPAPDAFSGFSNALIGRPLALAHAGWSLELAGLPLSTQAVGDSETSELLRKYVFDIKVGDASRGFDGLVGVFDCEAAPGQQDLGLVLDKVYSDFDHDPPSPITGPPALLSMASDEKPVDDPPKRILPNKKIPLGAFYISPENDDNDRFTELMPSTYVRRRNLELAVRGVLLDPFSPIHTYSGIVPVQELVLPAWTWQRALANIKAFFHLGPLVVTKDVPSAIAPGRELQSETPVVLPDVDSKNGLGAVALPGLGNGDWAWLQPYYPSSKGLAGAEEEDSNSNETDGESSDGSCVSTKKNNTEKDPDDPLRKPLERYTALPVKAEDEHVRYEPGPYTAIEGYLLKVGRKEDSNPKS